MVENVNIVKIGSDSISQHNLEKVIDDAKKWEEETGEKFIFISSGAVKLGKERVIESGKEIKKFSKSNLASIGQSKLVNLFDEISGKEKLVGEILLDDYVNSEYVEKVGIENMGIIGMIKQNLRPCCGNSF